MVPPKELENVYRLVVTSLGVAGEEERLSVVLHHDHTGSCWPPANVPAAASELTAPLRAAILARLGYLGRRPEHTPVGNGEADPARVDQAIDTASVDDIAAWLWDHLPEPVRRELSRNFTHPVRLLVEAHGTASLLPWHRMSAWDEKAKGTRRLQASGHWNVWMYVDGGKVDEAPLQPRVLLLVGSQRQRPEADSAEYSVLDTVRAIREAGFRCDVAAGRPVVAGFDHALGTWTKLDSPEHAAQVIERGDYPIVHYVGRSDATQRADQSPHGASALEFEFAGEPEPRLLSLSRLRKALRQARTGLVVLHACLMRESVAYALLGKDDQGPGVVDAVLTMAAMAEPTVCATFAQAFYQRLRQDRRLPVALHQATLALAQAHPGREWLPILWTRCRHALRLADEREQRLARYCRWLVDTHRAFEGLFDAEDQPDVLDHIALDLDLTKERDRGQQQRHQRVLARVAEGQRLQFQHLLDDGGWWTLGGGPGSGKTTTLRLHARRLALDPALVRVPIYLPLASWLAAITKPPAEWRDPAVAELRVDRSALRQWLYEHVAAAAEVDGLADDFAALAPRSGLVVLLDGLDELSPELRTLFVGTLLPLLHVEIDGCSVVVATRRYQSAKRLPQDWFADADLCELAPEDAIGLLQNLLRDQTDTKATAQQHVAWFRGEIEAGAHLWTEVARTPLLVSLLARQLLAGKQPAASRLLFFESAFDVLCRCRHRRAPTPLPHQEEALRILRYLAFRLTRSGSRTASRAELVGWLEGQDQDPGLRPPEDVAAAIGARAQWLPVVPPHELDEPSAGEAFLRRVAESTLILGPEDTSPGAAWRFWHRSFQEALCARYLHERFVAAAGDEATGIAVLLAEVDRWGAGGEPPAALVERRERELRAEWQAADTSRTYYTDSQQAILGEAGSAPTDDPIARNRRFNALQGQAWVDAVLHEVAVARARDEGMEPFVEALGLLTDALGDAAPLLTALVGKSWLLALRVALAAQHLPRAVLGPLLAALPELGQREAVVERAVARVPVGMADDLLRALTERAAALAPLMRSGGRWLGSTDDGARHRRRAWDAPGELFVLDRGTARLVRTGRIAAAAGAQFRTRLLADLPVPDPAALQRLLTLVPGREHEPERGSAEPGVRLWRSIPPGEFWMGTAGGGPIGNEPRQRRVVERPFWIGAVPVTVGLYRLFAPQHAVWVGNGYRRVDDPGLDPATAVGCVSHHAARLYCIWLEHHAGAWLVRHLGAGQAVTVRLPSEVEWEYAARAGSDAAYCFGDDAELLRHWGWHGEGARGAPHPVAALRGTPGILDDAPAPGANRWGLFDVHGNVWEWCRDWYGTEEASKRGASRQSGRFRVLRGGSFGNVAAVCRSAYRFGNEPDGTFGGSGFRVVVSAPEPIMED